MNYATIKYYDIANTALFASCTSALTSDRAESPAASAKAGSNSNNRRQAGNHDKCGNRKSMH